MKKNPTSYNFCLKADSYKYSHWLMMPPGTTRVFLYGESRGGPEPEMMLAGMQYILTEHLSGNVFNMLDAQEADELLLEHFMGHQIFNTAGWRSLYTRHQGRLPVIIRMIPEGKLVPTGTPLFTVEGTDDMFPWLPGFVEDILMHYWYPSTVATQSHYMGRDIFAALCATSDEADFNFPFRLHDFGLRGVSCMEQARIGGAAHLITFSGSDNIPALEYIRKFYNTKMVAGFSVPAGEHSIACMWGANREKMFVKHMLETFGQFPGVILSIIADTYNVFRMVKDIILTEFKDEVLNFNGLIVPRPDSGDPVDINLRLAEIIEQRVGCTKNSKGKKKFPASLGLIQGDGIDRHTPKDFLEAMSDAGYAASNWVFGSGGGLLQKHNRDTYKNAIKASASQENGNWQSFRKMPITGSWKGSKEGFVMVTQEPDGTVTHSSTKNRQEYEAYVGGATDAMRTVFHNGQVVAPDSFETIRDREFSKYFTSIPNNG